MGIDSTIGATLIGCIVAAVVYGVTITQTYLYFERFPDDKYGIKIMARNLLKFFHYSGSPRFFYRL